MIALEKFNEPAFATLINWVHSPEELMQFAGPGFSYPLTIEQLIESLKDPKRIAFKLIDSESNTHIGHAEIYLTDNSAKLGRILIGDPTFRGKGLCKQIINELVNYVYSNTDRTLIELNVFDWNTGAIKCYEKTGFDINPGKTLERTVNGKTWIALNMILDNKKWKSQTAMNQYEK